MKRKKQKQNSTEMLNQELGIKISAIKCPNCGATITFDPEQIITFCSFCGTHLPSSEDLIKLSYDYLKFNRETELERTKTLYKEKQDKRNTITMIIVLVPILIIILFICIVMPFYLFVIKK